MEEKTESKKQAPEDCGKRMHSHIMFRPQFLSCISGGTAVRRSCAVPAHLWALLNALFEPS